VGGDADQIISAVQDLIDFSKPVAVVLAAVLHFIVDDESAARSVKDIRRRLAPASFFIVSHATVPEEHPERIDEVLAVYEKQVTPVKRRTQKQIRAMFEGMSLVKTKRMVYAPEWCPEVPDPFKKPGKKTSIIDAPARSLLLAGVFEVPGE